MERSKIWGRFFKSSYGTRGGRNISYLTTEQEKAFLSEFEPQRKQGQILEITRIHVALQQRISIEIFLSTIYRMWNQNGW